MGSSGRGAHAIEKLPTGIHERGARISPPLPRIGCSVDTREARCYSVRPLAGARCPARARKDLGGCREEDVSAAPQEPQAHAWISKAHEDAGRPRDHPSSSSQRAPAAHRDGREEVGSGLTAAVGPERRRERLPRAARVRHRKDYLAIQNGGRRVAGPNLLLFALSGGGRIGITVSRKVGGAVLRNRVKRWIRECYRRRRPDFPADLDLVVVARPGAASTSQAVVCKELASLARRLGARS